ncbi:hypothetical protein JCM7447_11310 [Corynebacterium amycolatum]
MAVSTVIRPVRLVAEVAVNSASDSAVGKHISPGLGAHCPVGWLLTAEIGSINKTVPAVIKAT